nr:immunoglobulin heavy chain junction region [Mus musculus]MBK4196724.1 immunoglobulin heavy chain junction region [Mus musculus]
CARENWVLYYFDYW